MLTEEIMEELDALMKAGKGAEAEAFLERLIRQAEETSDDDALLTFLNEMIGYKRETSQVEDSYRYADRAMQLMKRMEIDGSIPYATTLLNIANAYRAGGRLESSMKFYKEVLPLYQQQIDAKDMLFAGLYNNVSLLYQELGEYEKAKDKLLQALDIVKENEGTYFEEATTYANLANTCLELDEDESAQNYLEQAIRIFEEYGIRDAHYCAALSSLGTYLYKKKEFEKAADCFEKAMTGMKENFGENEYYHRLNENLEACRDAMKQAQEPEAERNTEKTAGRKPENGGKPENGRKPENGMTLCREYYEAYGKPMIHSLFGEYEDRIAVGLCGEGSECFGYDDDISRDHDWGPGFCMWVSNEVYEEIGDQLEKAYEELPKEFHGFVRKESRQGYGRTGVCTVSAFYRRILGAGNFPENPEGIREQDIAWTEIPDEAFAAAVNGEVFTDREGTFSSVRRLLKQGYPERVFYLKAAEACARFSQGAQYNYGRMMKRDDPVAAELSLAEGIRYAMKLLYYIKGEYPPHDKWLYRGILEKEEYALDAELISEILKRDREPERTELIEDLARTLSMRLYTSDIISDTETYLDYHTDELIRKSGYAAQTDEELAETIAKTEFQAFDKVRNEGGRASCQNDWGTFRIMRESQYLTWNRKMLLQYLYDFKTELRNGHNLIEEKYGRMMESTDPEAYAKIAENFVPLTEDKKRIIEAIVQIQVGFMEEFAGQYPCLAGNARSIHTYEDSIYNTSYETYLRGELGTYSDKMLELYGRFVVGISQEGKNLARLTMENSVHMYGYRDLDEAEEKMKEEEKTED